MEKLNGKQLTRAVQSSKIDAFICSSSFEERCFVVPNLINELKPKQILIFYNSNEVEEISINADKIIGISKNQSGSEKIKLNSEDPISNYMQVINAVENLISQHKSKPNLLIDTTTFTHETLLVLLKIIHLKKSVLGRVYLCYVGAEEYSTNTVGDEDKWLSKGVDQIRTILGYPGFTDPTKKNHLIILFGFEYERTKKIIDVYEFDIISLGFGDIPIQENHMKINYNRHKKLVTETPSAHQFTFSLRDPSVTKKQLLTYIKKPQLKEANTVIAPLNNKISTIGAGLAAIANENLQIAYAKASIYNTEGYSKANDEIYFGELPFD